MKTLTAIAIIALTTLTAQAGLFSAVQGMTMEEMKPSMAYTIDTNGINPRVYEFSPKGQPTKFCIMVVLTGDTPSSSLQCFDKTKTQPQPQPQQKNNSGIQ